MEQLTKQEKLQKLMRAIKGDYFGDFSTVEQTGTIYEITIEGERYRTTADQLLKDFDTLDEEVKEDIIINY